MLLAAIKKPLNWLHARMFSIFAKTFCRMQTLEQNKDVRLKPSRLLIQLLFMSYFFRMHKKEIRYVT